jgi:hypothetical protein
MTKEARPLYKIAEDISRDWGTKVNNSARPYLQAMFNLCNIDDYYYMDTADSVVRYFLCNATTWRGETARTIKAELKEMLK